LEGGDEAVQAEGKDAGTDEGEAAVFADPLPDQPRPPISAIAASTNSRMERSTVIASQYLAPSDFAGIPAGSAGVRPAWLAGCTPACPWVASG
jgi:hypothetical protein